MPNLKQRAREEWNTHKRRQEYLKLGVCMNCGSGEDHNKEINGVYFSHQFEDPSSEDFKTDEDFIDSLLDQAVAEERERLINLVKLTPIETYVAFSKKSIDANRAFDTGKAYMKDQIIKTITTPN